MKIDRIKVWFDDRATLSIKREFVNVWKDKEFVGKTLRYGRIHYGYKSPEWAEKNKDKEITKPLKDSIESQLYDFMNRQNKDFEQ